MRGFDDDHDGTDTKSGDAKSRLGIVAGGKPDGCQDDERGRPYCSESCHDRKLQQRCKQSICKDPRGLADITLGDAAHPIVR